MSEPNVLHVYLLDADPTTGRRVFHAPTAADHEEAPTPHAGVRGWVEARHRRLREGWHRSDGRAARLGRRAWQWLHSRTHPDEPLLARLRAARGVEVVHPATLPPGEAARAWSEFLAAARRRHRRGLAGHALVAPLSVVLAPLPGPNLLGYWFAYRAAHHWLILVGLGRVRRGLIATTYRAGAAFEPVGPVPDRPPTPGRRTDPGARAAVPGRHS